MPVAPAVDDADTAHWRARAEHAEAVAERLEARVGELTEQVAVLSRMLFGRSSERNGPPSGGEPASAGGDRAVGGEDPPELSRPAGLGRRRGQRPGSKGHGRRDYSHLETREEIYDVGEADRVCSGCGVAFEPLGTDDSEQIHWQVTLTRVVHRRRRYRRRCNCPGPRTVTAVVPAKPVAKGRFTAAFLARRLYEKYILGLPLHRIARVLSAAGLDVAEGTLCGALKDVHALLAPLDDAIAARTAAAGHVHADETMWRVFERVEGKDGTRWWLWVFVAADTVVFRMDPTRSAAVMDRHFGVDWDAGARPDGRRLVVSSDFYVYQSLARIEGVDPLWCWAHIRWYFIRAGDAHAQLRYWRDQWVARIGVLYVAHRDLAAAEPGSAVHREAGRRSTRRWAPSTRPAARRPRSTACTRPRRRSSPRWTGSGTGWSVTGTFPTSTWTTMPPSGRCGRRSSAGRTTTAPTPSGRRTSPPGARRSLPRPSATAASRWRS